MAKAVTLERNVAGAEDLLLDASETPVIQSRNGTNVPVTPINAAAIPYEDNGLPEVPNPSIKDVVSGQLIFPKVVVGTNTEGKDLANILSHTESAGVIAGCALTNNLALVPSRVDITTGTALMRTGTDSHDDLHTVQVDPVAITDLPDNTTSYIIATYSGDGLTNAVISHTTDPSAGIINMTNKVAMYVVTRQGNDLKVINVLEQNVDFIAKHQRKIFDVSPFQYSSGAAIDGEASLNLTISAGVFYFQTTRIAAQALAMPADSLDTYYGTTVGGFTRTTGVTAVTTEYFSDPGLTAIGANKYAVQWIYAILDTTGNTGYAIMYGDTEYPNLGQARDAAIPSDIPDILLKSGVLIGRIIISDTEIFEAESRFGSTFTAGVVADHFVLTNLQGGQAAEYYHLTAAEHAEVTSGAMSNRANVVANTATTLDPISGTSGTSLTFNTTIGYVLANGKNSNNALQTIEETITAQPNIDVGTGNETASIVIQLADVTGLTVSTVLTGDTSGATGTVTAIASLSVTLNTLTGVFVEGETLNTSAYTFTSFAVDYKKRYLLIDELKNITTSESKMNAGLNRSDADKWGEYTDWQELTKTTARHNDYESSTGVASSSTKSDGYEPYLVFNKAYGLLNSWLTVLSTLTGWIQYQVSEKKVIKSYSIRGEDSDITRSPKNWTLKASNTGQFTGEEVILDTQVGIVFTVGNTQTFTVSNTVKYLYYRLDVTLNNGDIQYLGIGELQLNFDIQDTAYINTDDNVVYDKTTGSEVVKTLVEVAEFKTDGQGIPYDIVNYQPNKTYMSELVVSNGLTVHNDFELLGGFNFNQKLTPINLVTTGDRVRDALYKNNSNKPKKIYITIKSTAETAIHINEIPVLRGGDDSMYYPFSFDVESGDTYKVTNGTPSYWFETE